MLIKGQSTKSPYVIKETMQGKRHGREKGDVPVYLLNSNVIKDAVYAGLQRSAPGPGYYHFPAPKTPNNPNSWLPMSFFDELNAEIRN
jgi:phage terminase large subunit GpA-like protein